MSESNFRFTLAWGEMKLELEGDATPMLVQLQDMKVNGPGRLAEFFPLGSARSPQNPTRPPTPSAPGASPTSGHSAAQFTVASLKLPATQAEVRAMAQRYGSTAHANNQAGSVLSAMTSMLSETLGAGTAAPSIWLLFFESAGSTSALATLTVKLGHERSDTPGSYVADDSVPALVFHGATWNDTFVSNPESAPTRPLLVALDPPLPMGLEIHDPYIELNLASPTMVGGKLQGVVLAQIFKESVLQAVGGYVAGKLASDPASDAAKRLRTLFLQASAQPDHVPTGTEMTSILRDNPLINSLLAPDTTALDGNPSLSVAVSFAARVL